MITQSTPFTTAVQKTLISSFFDGTNYIGTEASDLNTATTRSKTMVPVFSTNNLTITAHGLSLNAPLFFLATPGAVFPTNIVSGTRYYVKAVVDADTITISATAGGTVITPGTTYSGVFTAYFGLLDPQAPIKTVKNTSFTIPEKFFGVNAAVGGLAGLGAAGAKTTRIHDIGCMWSDVNPLGGQVTSFTAGSTNTVNKNSHGAIAGSHGVFFDIVGGTLPSGITFSTMYYVVNSAANTFQVALTPGGAAISLGTTGSGTTNYYLIDLNKCNPATGGGSLDLFVAAAFAAGMDICYDCSQPPSWLTTGGNETTIPSAQNYVTRWLNFLANVYGNKIAYYQVWNEPNTAGYFTGTSTGASNDLWTYATYLKTAISALGRSWYVVSPSWNLSSGAALMATWLNTDAGNATIDIVSCHCYRGGTGYLGIDYVAIDLYMQAAALWATGKEVWITEAGESFQTDEAFWRYHLYAAGKGVARCFLYCYDVGVGIGGRMRLTDYDNLPTEYKAMITACANKTCTYVNQAKDGRVGANVNGTALLY